MLRIGMLTSGGDCQALNAAIRTRAGHLQTPPMRPWWIFVPGSA